ncbi:hypothetical protein [Desulfatirhabdium butyrativorans]|uniref:hypothetical protein n=1 Tax=Desulfatirhabdium butyrativorans TaxID=340467 RepID=UPI0004894AD9|nr:hypothetical protein [Desulfatirhabdium butyrativorans]
MTGATSGDENPDGVPADVLVRHSGEIRKPVLRLSQCDWLWTSAFARVTGLGNFDYDYDNDNDNDSDNDSDYDNDNDNDYDNDNDSDSDNDTFLRCGER